MVETLGGRGEVGRKVASRIQVDPVVKVLAAEERVAAARDAARSAAVVEAAACRIASAVD